MNVSVLIPAFNEEDKIKTTIDTVFKLELVDEVIVVVDGSTDATYQQTKKTKAKVIQLPYNQGKGAALNHGLRKVKGDIILLIDADLEQTAIEAQKLLAPVVEEKVDMTIAKFPPVQQNVGCGLVKKLATWGLKKITGRFFSAPLSGQRAMKREVLKKINKFAAGFRVEVALTIDAWQAGFEIAEIPVEMKHRITANTLSGFWHRGKQFKDVALVLFSRFGK
ncbi:MAG: glycosyltransferase family 2 protein [Bacillota bacterium]